MMTPTVMHELMHVIGLWHEHQRYDRDKYIDVIFENIAKEYHDQFTKVSPSKATTYNVPYTYTSVMHYGQRAFAEPNKISMRTKNPEFQDVIGNADDASPFDYMKICEIYGCKQCMGRSQ
ncbi:astacin [Cooperia oncophora]